MRLLLNVLWFVLGGWVSLLAWIAAGLILAITIVGLPWSASAFRIAGFSAAPFGRQAVPRRISTGRPLAALEMVLNVVWFVLAGWWLTLQHLILALGLFITIIGIPFGLQHLKLAVISIAPVGTSVVEA